MTKNTSGPAFPIDATNSADRCVYVGMSLRDYFAAKAMQSNMTALSSVSITDWHAHIAELAYLTADAMLKAREA